MENFLFRKNRTAATRSFLQLFQDVKSSINRQIFNAKSNLHLYQQQKLGPNKYQSQQQISNSPQSGLSKNRVEEYVEERFRGIKTLKNDDTDGEKDASKGKLYYNNENSICILYCICKVQCILIFNRNILYRRRPL